MVAATTPLTSLFVTPTYSGDVRIDSLLRTGAEPLFNYLKDVYLPPPFDVYGARTILYYSFDVTSADVIGATPGIPSAFNANQKAAAISVLNYISTLTGIRLKEVATGGQADIHFATTDLAAPGSAGEFGRTQSGEWYASGGIRSYTADAYVFLDNKEFAKDNDNPAVGTLGYQFLLHEIGHIFGLGHPFEAGSHNLPADQDNTNNTVMSYNQAGSPKSAYQANDLLALQWIYGGDGIGGKFGMNSTFGPTLTPVVFSNSLYPNVDLGDVTNASGGSSATNSTSANDYIFSYRPGVVTVNYSGPKANFTITNAQGSIPNEAFIVKDNTGAQGTDGLSCVDRLKFTDASIALDIGSNAGQCTAGQVYRLYQAAFNRTPDKGGLGDWIYAMDAGMSLLDVSAGFISSAEFKAVYGENPTNAEVITRFYQNVLHRAPEQAGYDYWMNQLESGAQTRTQVLTGFSESPENQAQIIGVIQNGIEYTQHAV